MTGRIDVQTKSKTGRIYYMLAATLFAVLVLWVVVDMFRASPPFSGLDVSALGSSRLGSWDTLERQPDGALLRTVREPLALFRNIALILLATMGLALGARQFIGQRRRSVGDGVAMKVEDIESFRHQLADELQAVLELFQTHSKQNQAFSAALNSGRANLAASRGEEQIRSVIQFVVSASQQMLRANEDYEKKLRDSRAQIDSLRATLEETQELVSRDSLTGVYSRRHFDETLPKQTRKAAKNNQALSLIMADIDHFKSVNDRFGHPIGDEVLRKFSDLLIANTKGSDSVARYGGEEFVVILPETPGHAAASLAEQIRKKLEEKRWIVKGGSSIGRITASFGVAEFSCEESPDDLVLRADAKLYLSKAAGRNKVSA